MKTKYHNNNSMKDPSRLREVLPSRMLMTEKQNKFNLCYSSACIIYPGVLTKSVTVALSLSTLSMAYDPRQNSLFEFKMHHLNF